MRQSTRCQRQDGNSGKEQSHVRTKLSDSGEFSLIWDRVVSSWSEQSHVGQDSFKWETAISCGIEYKVS